VTSRRGGSMPWVLLGSSALVQAATFLMRPAATYQAIDLGAPGAVLGALAAAFALVPLCLAVPLGRGVDLFGERRTMIVGAVVFLGSAVLFLAGPPSIATVLIATALLGAGHLGCMVGQQALIANSYTELRLDAMFGYYTLSASFGQVMGPLLIVFTGGGSTAPPTAPIFTASVVMSVLLVGTTLVLRGSGVSQAGRTRDRGARGGVVDLLRTPGVVKALIVSGMILASIDLLLVYLPALGTERGLSAAVVGGLLALRAGSSMLTRLVLVRLTRHLGRTRVVVGGVVLSALSLAALPIPMHPLGLVGVVLALGAGLGVVQPLTMAWLSEAAPPGQRGRAMSLRLGGNRLGQFLIPPVMGSVAAGLGAAGVLWALAATLGASALLLRGVDFNSGQAQDGT
jgi:MFS family permease